MLVSCIWVCGSTAIWTVNFSFMAAYVSTETVDVWERFPTFSTAVERLRLRLRNSRSHGGLIISF